MKAIYRNEIRTYFTTLTGYIFCAFMLLFAGIYTMVICLKQCYSDFQYVLGQMSFVFLIIVPIITMRVVAEERRQRTDQLLYSLPISTTEIIMGKYLALLTVLLIPLAIIALFPLLLSSFGKVNMPLAYGSLIAFFFLGAAFLAVGLFISSVTESQVLAAGICFAILIVNYFLASIAGTVGIAAYVSLIGFLVLAILIALVLYLMTKNGFIAIFIGVILLAVLGVLYLKNASLFEGLFGAFLGKLSLFECYYNFLDGAFRLKDLIFLLSVCAVFIFLSVQSMEKRRWS